MRGGLVGLVALAAVALVVLWAALARADEETLELVAGSNVVTWNGAAPHPMASFADTPVTRIHRWDAVEQRWLGHFVGQEDSSLPELHLLPRVQYLVVAEAGFDLVVPDPISGVDPYAELRFPAAPEDPLRFEAYWPNEDSPLEDLVVLRGEDERLSVEAWVAGGSGDIEVYWVLDGRVNHRELASDDVDLVPGRHDHGRLYAVDDLGPAVVKLPRVVRLPSLESLNLPDMQFGIAAYTHSVPYSWTARNCADWQSLCIYPQNLDAAFTTIDWIADAGFDIVRVQVVWDSIEPSPGVIDERALAIIDQIMDRIEERDLEVQMWKWIHPRWTQAERGARLDGSLYLSGSAVDPANLGAHLGLLAERYPQIRYWQIGNEPELKQSYLTQDPSGVVQDIRVGSLAIWYENPEAVIVAPGMGPGAGVRDVGINFFEALQEAGIGSHVDVYAMHLYVSDSGSWGVCKSQRTPDFSVVGRWVDRFRAVIEANGEGHKQLWVTEFGVHSPFAGSEEDEAACILHELAWLDQRPDLSGAFVHTFLQNSIELKIGSAGIVKGPYIDGQFTPKPAYWAIREYLTGQPPPE